MAPRWRHNGLNFEKVVQISYNCLGKITKYKHKRIIISEVILEVKQTDLTVICVLDHFVIFLTIMNSFVKEM